MTFCVPRNTCVNVVCPSEDCRSPEVRRVRRKRGFVWLQCKACAREWSELPDGVMVRALVILPPTVLRIATTPVRRKARR
ncbi:MAG: hypothetical protein RLZZ524_2984 [Pseudomonadota bacterium]|jgi:hypothetical protein